MLDLSNNEVSVLNNEDDLINSVSLVSVADLRQQQKQQKVCIPADTDEFMLILKRYENLVYVIFFGDLPTFQSVEIVDSCVEGFVS